MFFLFIFLCWVKSQLVPGTQDTKVENIDPRLVTCKIGSEKLKFLVDSGASVNTMTIKGWESIQRNCRTSVLDVVLEPKNVLKGYACNEPLELECSFRAFICLPNKTTPSKLAKFFVVRGTNIPLLSYSTAVDLKLLNIKGDTYDRQGICPTCDLRINVLRLDNKLIESNEKFPKVPMEPVKFRIDEAVVPKQIIRYNIPKAFERHVNERLQKMEKDDIIERADAFESKITSVSPLVIVPKGVNDFRIVVDYREVNKAIIREPYPMPSLEKIWTKMPGASQNKLFTKLHLKDAYFHIELHKDVRHITTFMTANGLYRFKRLPFGLSCAPELFQKIIERILANVGGVIVYLDDILIIGNSQSELNVKVDKVKAILKRNNLSINEAKSEFNKEKVNFLGFTIDGKGVLPLKEKVEEVQNFEKPKDISQLRSFLGLMTFISPFILNFSHRTKPLRDMLKSERGSFKQRWGSSQEEAYNNLKHVAVQDILKRGYFNDAQKTILYTDASPWGLGAVLTQESEYGEKTIIACSSKSLTETESRYPQLHREALAILWAMERFHTIYWAGSSSSVLTVKL